MNAAKKDATSRGPFTLPKTFVLPIMLASALALRVLIAAEVAPQSDVYYFLAEASRVLLSGSDPYLHLYTTVPPALLTPGSEGVFAYLPASFLFFSPFSLLGDVRTGAAVGDLIIGASLYLYGGRWRLGAALLFLFFPATIIFATAYVNAAIAAIAFLSLFMLFETRGRGGLAAIFLGLAMATVQFCLLLLPLIIVYYYRTRRLKEPLIAAGVFGTVVLPFLLTSPSSFLDETLLFQVGRPLDPLLSGGAPFGFVLNPSADAVSVALLGLRFPFSLRVVLELVVILAFAGVKDASSFARNSGAVLVISAFVLPSDFFWSYLELPLVLLLFWASSPGGLAFVKES